MPGRLQSKVQDVETMKGQRKGVIKNQNLQLYERGKTDFRKMAVGPVELSRRGRSTLSSTSVCLPGPTKATFPTVREAPCCHTTMKNVGKAQKQALPMPLS